MAASLNLQGSSYIAQMRDWSARNELRLAASKKISPAPLAFSNIPFPPSITLPLFEAKAAVAVPTKYYQQLAVDNSPLRNDWAHDFCRSVGFIGDDLLLISQSIAKKPDPLFASGEKGPLSAASIPYGNDAPFRFGRKREQKAGGEVFLHYLAVKFAKGEFSFSDKGNGKFEIAAHDVKKEGTNLLNNSPSSHSFSFSFIHNPTKLATMSSTSFRASALSGSIYGQHGGLARASDESVITVAHLEPHPYLLVEHAAFGYASRHDFINDASALLAGCLKK